MPHILDVRWRHIWRAITPGVGWVIFLFMAPNPWFQFSPYILLYPSRCVHSYLLWQPVSNSSVLIASCYPFVPRSHPFPVLYSRYFNIRPVKIILGLSLFSAFNIMFYQETTKHIARTILSKTRLRLGLRVRERVACPYTFDLDVVKSEHL